MPKDAAERPDAPRDLSRRNLLKGVGLTGAAAATTFVAVAPPSAPAAAQTAEPRLEALETLTADEADTLDAIVARLIPDDENGPGAKEARVTAFIDRSLGGPLMALRTTYSAGLAATDAYAQVKKGKPFAELSAEDQDAILTDMEKNTATGFTPNSAAFFGLVRTHTIHGMFADPYYGGNAEFIGWDLVGYPGLRMAVSEDEQKLRKPDTLRQSAYDASLFGRGNGGGHGH
jgi:gluconate 2-dehydrogenase gamma chain